MDIPRKVFNIHSGVPQGSVLGPLLFLVFINDLETDNVSFFADNTMLFDVVNDPHTTSVTLNQCTKLGAAVENVF